MIPAVRRQDAGGVAAIRPTASVIPAQVCPAHASNFCSMGGTGCGPRSGRDLRAVPGPSALACSGPRSWCAHTASAIEFDLRPWVGHEAVAIGHRNRRQAAGIKCRILRQDVRFSQNERHHAVYLLVAERSRRGQWHRAFDIIEQRGGIRPIALDGPDGRLARKRAAASNQPVATDAGRGYALQLVAVTCGAGLRIDLLTRCIRALAEREAAPVRRDREKPRQLLR